MSLGFGEKVNPSDKSGLIEALSIGGKVKSAGKRHALEGSIDLLDYVARNPIFGSVKGLNGVGSDFFM